MEVIIAGLIGAIIGTFITCIFYSCKRSSGTLRIDRSNPEKDVYRIEVDDLDRLAKKTRLELKVDSHANFSHE